MTRFAAADGFEVAREFVEVETGTLGLHEGSYVIGDGLHRARTFLVASAPSTIAVYMPLR